MPPKRNRQQFEYDTLATIQHIDISNNNMLEAAIKASLEGAGLEEAKEESRKDAGNHLFEQVMEQLPGLTPNARRSLLLIVGLDDIISNEKTQGHETTDLQEIQQKIQSALDSGLSVDQEYIDSATAFIEGYDMDQIIGAVYPRIDYEIDLLNIKDAEDEEAESKEIEDAIMASLAAEEVKEAEPEAKEETKQLTREELRAARLAFLDKPKIGS
uniref:Uncharacterized protein n=1 Tax=viral metagenome TaxID=1070528 RepID=A0A6C0BI53_9ZZZZ